MRRLIQTLTVVVLLLCGLQACGRKGSPKPPETTAPGAVENVVVKGSVHGIDLSWNAPQANASGAAITDLEQFVVKRREFTGDAQTHFENMAEVPFDKAAAGKRYMIHDDAVAPGKTYEYMIYAENDGGVLGVSAGTQRVIFRGSTSVVEQR